MTGTERADGLTPWELEQVERDMKGPPADFVADMGAAERQAAADEAAHAGETLAAAGIVFPDFDEFMDNPPTPFDWIIEDQIAKGFKCDLFGKSKTRKSYFALQLALCVSMGRDFLGFRVPRPRRVAYFNLELPARGLWERFEAMARTLGGRPAGGMLHPCNLRDVPGKELRNNVDALVAELARLRIDLAIIDPRYKLFEGGEDENTAAGMRAVLDFRDKLLKTCAVLWPCHDPKGSVAGKDLADRGAGSHTGGADNDFGYALSPHANGEETVLSFMGRARPTPPDRTIRFNPGLQIFEVDADTPAEVQQPAGRSPALTPEEKAGRESRRQGELEEAVVEYTAAHDLVPMATFRADIMRTAAGSRYGVNALREALDALIGRGLISKTPEKVRTAKGEIKHKQRGTMLVGTPEKVRAYDAQFQPAEEVPF